MDKKQKGNLVGIFGTVIANGVIIGILLLIHLSAPQDLDGGGVPVILGSVSESQGMYDPKTMVDVEVMNTSQQSSVSSTPDSDVPLITQEDEETVVVEKKKETPKKEKPKKEVPKKVEKTAAEKKAEAEKLAKEKAERERKAAAEAAAKKVSGAFGKGSQMESNKGTSTAGSGVEGSTQGNSNTGEKTGVGSIGHSVNLGGRSLGSGGIPLPIYTVKEEGRVVIEIKVNPAGKVTWADVLTRETTTVNPELRREALNAAKKARFIAIEGDKDQMGTITYNFKLR